MSLIYTGFKNLWYNQVNKKSVFGGRGMSRAAALLALAAFFLCVRLAIEAVTQVERIAVNFERRLGDAETAIYRLEATCEKSD